MDWGAALGAVSDRVSLAHLAIDGWKPANFLEFPAGVGETLVPQAPVGPEELPKKKFPLKEC